MKTKKVWIAALLLILLSILVLAACSQKTATESGDSPKAEGVGNDSNLNPAGVFPIVKNKVTLKVMLPKNEFVEDYATNEFTKWYEEKTNVHIEFEVVPSNSVAEKLNLALSSGDYPDILMSMAVSPAQQMIYGKQGVFLPLNKMIDKYGVETKKLFKTFEGSEDAVKAPDGSIYSMPNYTKCYHCTFPQKMWINQKWLDKLGLKMPTTTDEFYNVLKAFKTKDPNGNGKADEIPLSGSTGCCTMNEYLMDSFIYGNADRLFINKGKIDTIMNKPQYKEGLKYIHKLYADGLIAPETFTQDANQLKRMGEDPTMILGAAPGLYMGQFTQIGGESGRWKNYLAVPPLKGPDGTQIAAISPFFTTSGKLVITNKSKYPEVALRWADAFYNEEVFMRQKYGIEGIDWKKPEPGMMGIDGKPAVWLGLIPYHAKVQNRFWDQIAPILETSEFRLGVAVLNPANEFESILYTETKKYEPHAPDMSSVVPPLFFTEEQSNKLADLKKSTKDYADQMFDRFVTGDADIETGWSNYVSTLEGMNLKGLLDIYQAAYDAKTKK